MQKVFLDTNFMISALRFKIDIEAELQRICNFRLRLCVFSGTIYELEKLINRGKLFERRLAKLALRLIEQKGLEIVESEGHVDDLLAALNPKTAVIATQDRLLKKKLKEKGFRLVTIRQKKRLALE